MLNCPVHYRPLNESPLKDHPLNPMHDANLVRVFARQSRAPVSLVPLQVVEQGADAVRAALAKLAAQGDGAAIVDAVNDANFEVLGQVAPDSPVSTGASGISLARALRRRDVVAEHVADAGGPVPVRFAAILAGSFKFIISSARAKKSGPLKLLDFRAVRSPA